MGTYTEVFVHKSKQNSKVRSYYISCPQNHVARERITSLLNCKKVTELSISAKLLFHACVTIALILNCIYSCFE